MAAAVDADGNAAARQWRGMDDLKCPPRCFGPFQRKNYLRFWGSEKPAGFSEPLFHGWGRGGKRQLPRLLPAEAAARGEGLCLRRD